MNKLEEKQMKQFKKGLSLLVALMLLMSMTMAFTTTAFAAGTSSITIKQPGSTTLSNEGQVFNAYKVFDLTYSGDAYTYTVAADFKAFFSDPPADLGLSGDMTDPQIAAVISALEDDGAEMRIFGDALAAYINTHMATVHPAGTATGSKTGNVTINNLELGYYLVTGSVKIGNTETSVVASCSLTSTNPTADVTPKFDVPSIEKEVNGDATDNASIGDTVDYTITARVPANLALYDTYTFTIHDKMGEGLTFNDDVVVTVGGMPYSAYTVTSREKGNVAHGANCNDCTLHITFDTTEILKNMGETVVATYSATINEKAVIGGAAGNSNAAYLEFSNDPFSNGKGTTVPDTTNVYTYYVDIFKFTGSSIPLANAIFKLQTAGGEDIGLVLMNPGDGTNPAVYRHMNATEKAEGAASAPITTPESGLVKIIGLGAGDYKLTETQAPDGYNLLPDSVRVEILADNNNIGFTVTYGTGAEGIVAVENLSGTEFPGTGGIGRTIFTISGSILMAGALAALYFRRKVTE